VVFPGLSWDCLSQLDAKEAGEGKGDGDNSEGKGSVDTNLDVQFHLDMAEHEERKGKDWVT
jgi:hypothetical protein